MASFYALWKEKIKMPENHLKLSGGNVSMITYVLIGLGGFFLFLFLVGGIFVLTNWDVISKILVFIIGAWVAKMFIFGGK
jgi:hypothetical protein